MFAVLSTSIFMWDIWSQFKKNMVLIYFTFQRFQLQCFLECLLAKTYNDSDPYHCIASRAKVLKVVSLDVLRFGGFSLAFA